MSNQGDYGQNQAGAPQWGAPQQGFDPNQTQGHGQGFAPYGAPMGQQPEQQWGAQPAFGQPPTQSKPLPWTLRELILLGVGVLLLVFSFFPAFGSANYGINVWQLGSWILVIAGPLIAVALLALRPFVPVVSRIGSLSVDQFASVAFSVAVLQWLGTLLSGAGAALAWAGWLMLLLSLGGIVLTVAAPFIPGLKEEFDLRPEESAPRAGRTTRVMPEGKGISITTTAPQTYAAPTQNTWGQQQQTGAAPTMDSNAWSPAPAANAAWTPQAEPVTGVDTGWATPAAPAAAVSEPNGWAPSGATNEPGTDSSTGTPVADDVSVAHAADPVATEASAEPATTSQAFWALVPEDRPVVDENGTEVFRVGPTAWALVVDDRGSSFVIRHDDGRTGTLNDVSGVTRN